MESRRISKFAQEIGYRTFGHGTKILEWVGFDVRRKKLWSCDLAFDICRESSQITIVSRKKSSKIAGVVTALLSRSVIWFSVRFCRRRSKIIIVFRKVIASVLTPLLSRSLTCYFVLRSQITTVSRIRSTEVAWVLTPLRAVSLGSRTWRKICTRSSTKPGRQKIPPFCSAAPGRRLPATVAPLPACPQTAAFRLALCPSLSRVSLFTFVLTCVHLPILHRHGYKRFWWERDWELDKNKAYFWEQNEFDGNCLGTW